MPAMIVELEDTYNNQEALKVREDPQDKPQRNVRADTNHKFIFCSVEHVYSKSHDVYASPPVSSMP